jgi:beta-glucosidase
LNDALFHVLRARFRLGEFDPPAIVPFSKIPPSVICCLKHRELSLQTARESIVLLQNLDRLLPLEKSKLKTLAVIGPHADLFTAGGYSGKVKNSVTPLAGVKNRAARETEILYEKGCDILPPKKSTAQDAGKRETFAKAVAAAKRADAAIVFVGTILAVEEEGRDRTALALPGDQEALVEAVFAANPRTVVVLLNAGPLTIPWIKEHVPAVVEAWWNGEEGGNAIADVLFGNFNPGGRLPFTIYASESQVPPQDEYDINNGFTYMYVKGEPLFPFGHGLSYTEFCYSNLQITPQQIPPNGEVKVSAEVENNGDCEGDEVVQLYVRDVECSVKRPCKELLGFARIHLKSGEKQTVAFALPGEKLAFYDEKTHKFMVEPGEFEVLIGGSSNNPHVTGAFFVVPVEKHSL